MKHIRLTIATLALVFATIITVQAQAPYHYGFGVTAGNMQALSFKACSGHFAFQLDLGTKVVKTNGLYRKNVGFEGLSFWDLELNPNFMFEGHFGKGLYGMFGLGLSIGYCWNDIAYPTWIGLIRTRYDLGKCGANGIFGLEYKFNAPVALQFDFRPGYGCLFADNVDIHYFDWSVNLGVHYAF